MKKALRMVSEILLLAGGLVHGLDALGLDLLQALPAPLPMTLKVLVGLSAVSWLWMKVSRS